MKIKITADGGIHGTHVEEAETGERLRNVRAVQFEHRAGAAPELVLEVALVEASVQGEPRLMVGPYQDVVEIVLKDGRRIPARLIVGLSEIEETEEAQP